jgi:hypothetical protein
MDHRSRYGFDYLFRLEGRPGLATPEQNAHLEKTQVSASRRP